MCVVPKYTNSIPRSRQHTCRNLKRSLSEIDTWLRNSNPRSRFHGRRRQFWDVLAPTCSVCVCVKDQNYQIDVAPFEHILDASCMYVREIVLLVIAVRRHSEPIILLFPWYVCVCACIAAIVHLTWGCPPGSLCAHVSCRYEFLE